MLSKCEERLVALILGIAFVLGISICVYGTVAEIPTIAGGKNTASLDGGVLKASGQSNSEGRAHDHPGDRSSLSEENDWAFLPSISRNYDSNRLTYLPSNDTHPAFSPDSETIVFVSDRDGRSDVLRVRTAGGPVVNLSRTALADEDTPVFSPDGSQVAFASNRSGDWDIYLMDPDGTNVRAAVENPSSDELHPSFGPDSRELVFSSNLDAGNWDIYTATIGSEGPWGRLTSDPTVDRFPTFSADGMAIAFRSERAGNSDIYVMTGNGSDLRQVTDKAAFDGYPTFTPDGSGIVFASNRSARQSVYLVNLAGKGLIDLGQDQGWRATNPRVSAGGRQLVYAGGPVDWQLDIYRRGFVSPLFAIGRRGATDLDGQCNWEEGVLAFGWIHAWRGTGDDQYRQWARGWVDACIPVKTETSHVNDGLLGYAALTAYETSGQPKYLAFANQVADYLIDTAPRTTDGTLTHDSQRVWVDTLLGAVPFLTKMSQISGSDIYVEEAITQTIKHADHLQDPDSGLYYHAWDETQSNPAGHVYWGRGNGWALLADVLLLSTISDSHPSRPAILDSMRRQAAGLKTLQDASGLWRTVLTRSDSYVETSASSLIGYGLNCGVQQGWLDGDTYSASAEAARLGIWPHVLADGTVTDVSAPTWPMVTEEDYNKRPHDELQLYGQGLALLLESPGVGVYLDDYDECVQVEAACFSGKEDQ